ncbi:MAG: VCBS repeat-containing protein [bacterium]
MKRFVFLLFFLVFQYIQADASSPTFDPPIHLKSNILDCGESVALSIGNMDEDDKQDMVVGDENGFVWFYKNIGENNSMIFAAGEKLTCPTGDLKVSNYATPYIIDWNSDNLPDLLVGDGEGNVRLFTGNGSANSPHFDDGSPLEDSNGAIDVGEYSCPYLADYNSDGTLDLLVGNGAGFVWYYPGQDSANPTIFGTGTMIQAMKAGTRTDMNVGGKAAPIFCDWNEDGLKDMIVSDEYGYINYFRNNGTLTSPAFGTASSRIKANNLDIDVGWEAKSAIINWDGDKKNDLLIADKSGQLTLFKNIGSNASPLFSSGSKIQGEETNLDAGDFSSPIVVDWNGDGKKDLICGDELGNISVYLNLGTNKFGARFRVQTSGTGTAGDLDVGDNSMPCIVDWNEDKKKDLLVGNKFGQIIVYLNSGTDSDPAFGNETILQKTVTKEIYDAKLKKTVGTVTYEDIDVSDNAAVCAYDWNNDSAIDLIVGNRNGDVGVFPNTGSNKQPVFGTYTTLLSAGKNINVRGYAVPIVCHWNNDGRKDLLVGSGDGIIYLYLNQGTDAAPVFFMAISINKKDDGAVIDVGENSTPVLVDWNNDGFQDLLIGNKFGEVFLSSGGTINSPPNITVVTPGTQNKSVSIFYVLRDMDSDSINIKTTYSIDGGVNWKIATPAGIGGDGKTNLFSTPEGVEHVFVWNALSDIGISNHQVIFRIIPSDTKEEGNPANTAEFIVDNTNEPKKRLITVSGAVLDVGDNAKPFVVDWDNDRRKDILVGNSLGQVYFLQNIGTDEDPMFAVKTKLSCGASDLDVGYDAAPVAVLDWNNDGKKDLIVGNKYGAVSCFKNINTDDSPSFDYAEIVGNGTKSTVDVGGYATPFVCNWNNDGKKDLVTGKYDGGIDVFINFGTDDSPVFGSATNVMTGTNTLLNIGNNSTVFVVDWNGNNKKDLICGSEDGKVYQLLNYGTNNAPLFYKPTAVAIDGETIDVGENSAPIVCYWNNDGIKDLLVGNKEGQLMLYLPSSPIVNTPPHVEITQSEEMQSGSITIAYILKDNQGDTCKVDMQYSTNGQIWKTASGAIANKTASPDGESYEFIWLSKDNLSSTRTQVSFRITPDDGTDEGSSSQISFLLDNLNTSEITNLAIIGTASGQIKIFFKVKNEDKSPVDIRVEYLTGSTWKQASIVGTTNRLLSDGNGVESEIVWLSIVDEPDKAGDYRIRITPSDYKGQGIAATSLEFNLNQINLSSRIIKKNEKPILTFSPTRIAIQKPFDEDMLATVEMMKKGLPEMDTYPELDNTVRRITITKMSSGEPVSSFQATLTIPYGTMTNYETEKSLQIYELEQDRWVKIGGTVDVNANEVSVSITHAGTYRIGLSISVDKSLKELTDTGVLWVAPNPFKPNDGKKETGVDRIVFGNLKAGTRVRIYTISGELVKESIIITDGSDKWDWYVKNEDGEDVGSGVYIYVISCGNDVTVIDKIAVIR